MEELLKRFMEARIRLIKYRTVLERPELVSRECVEVLKKHRRRAWEERDYKDIQKLSEEIFLLEGCLEHGVEMMFFGWGGGEKRKLNLEVPEEMEWKLSEGVKFFEPEEMEQKLRILEEAALMVEEERMPELVAELQRLTGDVLAVIHKGDRAENIEKAIEYYERSLKVFNRNDFPYCWAVLQINLAYANKIRIHGKKRENIERAIHHNRLALEVFRKRVFVHAWAFSQNQRAMIHAQSFHGDTNQNLEMAIVHNNLALEVITYEEFPLDWAYIQGNLGVLYMDRICGDKAENIERAIHHIDLSLKVRSREEFPETWASSINNLAIAYLDRFYGDRAENAERAINYFKSALEVVTRELFPDFWGTIHHNLALAYGERVYGDKAENIERAIQCEELALEVRTRDVYPEDWATTRNNLANSYLNRVEGDRDQNLMLAVHHCQKALEIFRREEFPVDWAKAKHNLGLAYASVNRGDRTKNIEFAVRCLRPCLEIYDVQTLARQKFELISILVNIYIEQESIEEAIKILEELDHADHLLRQKEITRKSSESRIEETSRLYALSAWCSLKVGNVERALNHIESGKANMLRQRILRDRSLFLSLNPDDKHEYETLELKLRFLEAEQVGAGPGDRDILQTSEEIREVRSRLDALTDKIREYEPEFLSEGLNFEEMQKCLCSGEDKAIISFVITEYGSGAVILSGRPGAPVTRSVIRDDFTDETLREFIELWTEELNKLKDQSDHQNARKEWGNFVDRFMGDLHTALFAPIKRLIDAIAPESIVIIPHKSLHILPLHLLNYMKNGERRYLLEDYEISFSPSLNMLHHKRKKRERVAVAFLAAADPTGDLPWSREEVRNTACYFEHRTVLEGAEARIENILKSASGSGVIHLACHGEYDMIDPYRSRLLMALPEENIPDRIEKKACQASTAVRTKEEQRVYEIMSLGDGETEMLEYNVRGAIKSRTRTFDDGRMLEIEPDGDRPIGEPWTLGRILKELRLQETYLAVLSACESGIVDIRNLPDECIGLPAGFLAAGAENVVSTLWKVSDESACRLMKIFYQNLMDKKMAPAEALRKAQLFLRSRKKYANPFFWGAFQVSGRG